MHGGPIRTVLVDDHQTLLQLLRDRLNREPDIDVVATADDGNEALAMLRQHRPRVAVLDVEMPGRGAFDLADELRSEQKNLRILFLTGYLSDVFIEQALHVRAAGYLMKGEPVEDVIAAVRRAANGELTYSPAVRQRIDFNTKRGQYEMRLRSALVDLTGRQLQVLRYLASGLTVKEVAGILHLSDKSVDSHKYRIMHKLGIHDRVELARYAIREGLLLP